MGLKKAGTSIKTVTVGRYLVRRLEQMGLRHIFGVPGDYALKFFDVIEKSGIELINTCNELNAGYAADGYARLSGVGAVCITYGVGGFSVYNAVAGAFAERVPVVVLSGGPKLSLRGRLHPYLLHHTIGDMDTQCALYRSVTQAAVVLTSAVQATISIDEVLAACLRHSRPVYIEIPADLVNEPCNPPGPWSPDLNLHQDDDVLKEAVQETAALVAKAGSPAILAGVEACRLGAREALLDIIRHTGFPVATTALGKGVVPEELGSYAGTYFGALANEPVRRTVEEADLLLCLGAWMTDIDLGGYTAVLNPDRMIVANSERVMIHHHVYDHVPLKGFLLGLRSALASGSFQGSPLNHPVHCLAEPFIPRKDDGLTTDRFWRRLNHFIREGHVLIADTGSATFDSVKLCLPQGADYISQSYYASIGYAVPAALGIGLAAPDMRPIVVVGDGAFQMTGQELSSLIRRGLNPVVFLLNNDGYQIERVIYDNLYNNLQMWDYTMLPAAYGGKHGSRLSTEGELETFLEAASRDTSSLLFAEVVVGRLDFSETLRKLGERLR
jgi:TPP-dependent 2-oxoacid decarboxylase